MSGFPAATKATAIRRELRYRRMVYPKRVEKGAMTKTEAAREIAVFEDILRDYEKLVQSEQLPLGE